MDGVANPVWSVEASGDALPWRTACPDWQHRILNGLSLVPDLPLNRVLADRAVSIFNRLRLPDVPGQPFLNDAAGQWQRDLVAALFGSLDANGVRHLQEVFALIPKKNSKALALDTAIATPDGFTTMGAVAVGDYVIAADGQPTSVIAKSEVFTGRRCFEVRFSTGETVVCDADHLWVTDAHADRDRPARTQADKSNGARRRPLPTAKTTAEIAATLKVNSGRYTINNHRTALCGPLDLPPLALPIPPYALGIWLGDGASAGSRVTAGCDEADALSARLNAIGQRAAVVARYPEKGSSSISLAPRGHDPTVRTGGFYAAARTLDVLGNKHIPALYLRASRAQRLELLCGLMDSDGNISTAGQASFTTTKPRLRDDVVELVASLGLKPSTSEWTARFDGRDIGLVWRVQFWPFAGLPVFKLHRKASRQKQRPAGAARSEHRQIVSVREVPSVPTQCIAVENETHQFLVTRSLIPTHNTTCGAAIMVTALIMNQRPRAEFVLVAPTQEISELAFRQAAGMIQCDPVLEAKFHIVEHLKRITYRPTRAFLKVKSFDTRIVTGGKPSGVLLDELHVIAESHEADRVIGQLRGGLLPNPEGFLLTITTQSERAPSGVFRTELHKARRVRDGEIALPLLPLLYEFPPGVDWAEPDNWPMVLPNLGRSITLPRLFTDYRAAVESGGAELARWASQHLNVEIGMGLKTDRWPGADYWPQRADKTIRINTIMARCECIVIGIDGGGLDDLFGLAVLGREKETKDWLLWTHGWCHTSVLEKRKSIAARLRDFEKAGELTIVTDELDDLSGIVEIVKRVKDANLLGAVAVDPAGLGELVDEMEKIGISQDAKTLIGVGQGYRMMNAIKTAERKLASGKMRHSGSGLMAWCVGNLKIEPTATAIRATKQNAGDAKIDPIMAAFDAIDVMTTNPDPVRKAEFQLFFA